MCIFGVVQPDCGSRGSPCLSFLSQTYLFAVSPTVALVVQQRLFLLQPLKWVGLHFAICPVNIFGDVSIDPRLVLLSAPIAPADHTHQSHLAIVSTDERPAGVSLCPRNNSNEGCQ